MVHAPPGEPQVLHPTSQICLKGPHLHNEALEGGRAAHKHRRRQKPKDGIHTEIEEEEEEGRSTMPGGEQGFKKKQKNILLLVFWHAESLVAAQRLQRETKTEKNEWERRCVKPPEKQHISVICISVCNYL